MKDKLNKFIGIVAGIVLSITVFALRPMPDTPSLLFFGEPEYPSED